MLWFFVIVALGLLCVLICFISHCLYMMLVCHNYYLIVIVCCVVCLYNSYCLRCFVCVFDYMRERVQIVILFYVMTWFSLLSLYNYYAHICVLWVNGSAVIMFMCFMLLLRVAVCWRCCCCLFRVCSTFVLLCCIVLCLCTSSLCFELCYFWYGFKYFILLCCIIRLLMCYI